MQKSGLFFLLFFGLFWTALVGTFDVLVGKSLYQQARTSHFAETSGTITASEVTRHRGNKSSTTFGVNIHYNYHVDDDTFTGDCYRHSGFTSSSDSQWAYAAFAQNPVGAAVKVFYDPSQPAEAVLSTGLDGGDLFLPLFLMPFNLIMLALLAAPVLWVWRKIRKPEAGGAKWSTDGRLIRVRLPHYSPFIMGATTTGGTSFLSLFVLAFSTGGHPSLRVALAAWIIALGAGIGVTAWQWTKQTNGSADLIIDQAARTVALPLTFGRKQPQSLALSELADVAVKTIAKRGRKSGTTYNYAVTLQRRNDHPGEKLTEWGDESSANELAIWLRPKLISSEPAAPPCKTKSPDGMPVCD